MKNVLSPKKFSTVHWHQKGIKSYCQDLTPAIPDRNVLDLHLSLMLFSLYFDLFVCFVVQIAQFAVSLTVYLPKAFSKQKQEMT